jgi:hypothetical protein
MFKLIHITIVNSYNLRFQNKLPSKKKKADMIRESYVLMKAGNLKILKSRAV